MDSIGARLDRIEKRAYTYGFMYEDLREDVLWMVNLLRHVAAAEEKTAEEITHDSTGDLYEDWHLPRFQNDYDND